MKLRKPKKGLGILIALVVIVSAFALSMAAPSVGAGGGNSADNKATHRPLEDFLHSLWRDIAALMWI